ncbi:MAG: hypothetical protein WB780_04420 [Candidatus Acidiferrales bacterium]
MDLLLEYEKRALGVSAILAGDDQRDLLEGNRNILERRFHLGAAIESWESGSEEEL